MGGERPKVLVELGGVPLVVRVLNTVAAAGIPRAVAVVGFGAQAVRTRLSREDFGIRVDDCLQPEQRGTGHAVQCAMPSLSDDEDPVFILSGDVPGLRAQTLAELERATMASSGGLGLLVFVPDDPAGYGRIVRSEGRAIRIVEHKDANASELEIAECNAGIYCVRSELLRRELGSLRDDNSQGELYLTDLVERAAKAGDVATVSVEALEVAGVNTPEQLSALERALA